MTKRSVNISKPVKRTFSKKEDEKLAEKEAVEIKHLQSQYEEIDYCSLQNFMDFPLSKNTHRALKEMGLVTPTDIQKQAIGVALQGSDVLGAAKTGSGKTLAFLIPVIEHLFRERWSPMYGCGALVITPTRELAYQIFDVLKNLAKYHQFSIAFIIGGANLKKERKQIGRCNIIICTPGRLLQHMDENPRFSCMDLQMLVLDEADRILDLGFREAMNGILDNLPTHRQTLLFSATQTKSVKDLARLSLKDPVYISVHEHSKHITPEGLVQSYILCELQHKINILWSFLKNHKKKKILVFMNTCKQVKYIYHVFCRMRPGIPITALYGTLHQQKRITVYEDFCSKEHIALFATDIAARGLDFPAVDFVIQFDCPEDANTYIHRVGRTARYMKGGEAVLFLMPSEKDTMLELLEERNVPISNIEVNPNRLLSVQKKMEALLAMDVSLKEEAQRAVIHYARSVFLMKNKKMFDVTKLDTDEFSHSLGLAIAPRIRFLQRYMKHLGIQSTKIEKEEPDTIEEDKKINRVPSPQQKLSGDFGDDSDDDDDDVLTMKRKDHELDVPLDLESSTESAQKTKKPTTKAAIAKKIQRKNIVANKKITFTDQGEAVEDFHSTKVSNLGREYDNKSSDGGINIETARAVLQAEDEVDRERYRQILKDKKRKQKLKKKEKLKKKLKDESLNEGDEESVDEDGTGDAFDWLPDPDEVYATEVRNDDDSSGSSKPEKISNKAFAKKRKMLVTEKSLTKKKKVDDSDATLTLNEEEELALKLLSQR